MSASPNLARAYLGLALTALFWAGNAVVARGVADSIPPLALAFWRWVLAAAILAPFASRLLWRDRAVLWQRRVPLAILAMLSVGMFNTFLYLAAQSTTAINITLFNATIPVVVAGLAWLLLSDQPSRTRLAGIALGLAGIAAIISRGDWFGLARLALNAGDLWMLAAVAAWGLYSVLLRRYAFPVHPLALLLAQILLGLPMILPFYLWEHAYTGGLDWSLELVPVLGFVGIFPSLLAYLFWNHGVHSVGPSRAALFIYLIPVFASGLAVSFLGEVLQLHHLTGAVLILAGLWLASRS